MIYIRNIKQISIQEPLSESWFESPVRHTSAYNEGMDPDFKLYIPPAASRRMGRLFKRATVTSARALDGFPVETLGGVITGTGLGCIENTEKFLISMIENEEKFLQPTYFMQSTHNTIGSQIALQIGCHGYNNTYSHRGTSFDGSLLDAYVQMQLGLMHSALVGAHDEMTPNYFILLGKSGYWKEGDVNEEILRKGDTPGSISGICSMSMLLSDDPGDSPLCRVRDMAMLYSPSADTLAETVKQMIRNAGISGIDAVVTGISGDRENDDVYRGCFSEVYGGAPVIWYKHLFGESFCSSAFGVYVAATCLSRHSVPEHILYAGSCGEPHNILVHNHFKDKDHSLVLLSC